jgi:hypothetical protein
MLGAVAYSYNSFVAPSQILEDLGAQKKGSKLVK